MEGREERAALLVPDLGQRGAVEDAWLGGQRQVDVDDVVGWLGARRRRDKLGEERVDVARGVAGCLSVGGVKRESALAGWPG